MPLEVVLIDLDNTLILYDELCFFQMYGRLAADHFSGFFPPEEWQAYLIESTRSLLRNRGSMTNEQFFLMDLRKRFGDKSGAVEKHLLSFNDGPYEELRQVVAATTGAVDVVDALNRQGFRLVLASNPILPLSLQLRRLEWSGLRKEFFELITHMGNMSYCKPQIEFYRQICDRLDVSPSTCLMVGNDSVNDMAAGHAGLKTYLTTDALAVDDSDLRLSRQMREESTKEGALPDFEGPLSEVLLAVDFLQQAEQ
ncbi:MAG: HAD family hydrolase [Candidatus Aminicenantes bacterium]|nr:HAD family hydrolase [Candidatus Aminicenantes bacterium]